MRNPGPFYCGWLRRGLRARWADKKVLFKGALTWEDVGPSPKKSALAPMVPHVRGVPICVFVYLSLNALSPVGPNPMQCHYSCLSSYSSNAVVHDENVTQHTTFESLALQRQAARVVCDSSGLYRASCCSRRISDRSLGERRAHHPQAIDANANTELGGCKLHCSVAGGDAPPSAAAYLKPWLGPYPFEA